MTGENIKVDTLKKHKDFVFLRKRGEYIRQQAFTLNYKVHSTKDIFLGYTISKKVSKKAVVRNRIRRRMKSAVSKAIKEINFTVSGSFVFICRLDIYTLEYEKLVQEIKTSLGRIGGLNEKIC